MMLKIFLNTYPEKNTKFQLTLKISKTLMLKNLLKAFNFMVIEKTTKQTVLLFLKKFNLIIYQKSVHLPLCSQSPNLVGSLPSYLNPYSSFV